MGCGIVARFESSLVRVNEINDPGYRNAGRVPHVTLAPLPTRAQF
jgi:hypothetical protein